jgi:hypothetical protein
MGSGNPREIHRGRGEMRRMSRIWCIQGMVIRNGLQPLTETARRRRPGRAFPAAKIAGRALGTRGRGPTRRRCGHPASATACAAITAGSSSPVIPDLPVALTARWARSMSPPPRCCPKVRDGPTGTTTLPSIPLTWANSSSVNSAARISARFASFVLFFLTVGYRSARGPPETGDDLGERGQGPVGADEAGQVRGPRPARAARDSVALSADGETRRHERTGEPVTAPARSAGRH